MNFNKAYTCQLLWLLIWTNFSWNERTLFFNVFLFFARYLIIEKYRFHECADFVTFFTLCWDLLDFSVDGYDKDSDYQLWYFFLYIFSAFRQDKCNNFWKILQIILILLRYMEKCILADTIIKIVCLFFNIGSPVISTFKRKDVRKYLWQK